MTTLITVKSGYADNTVALWEKHPAHVNGEIFIAGPGETKVARTRQVELALKAGILVEVSKETPLVEVEVEPEPTLLPADFPGYSALVKAGYDTIESVRAASDEDLDSIDGIGPATLKAIRDAL